MRQISTGQLGAVQVNDICFKLLLAQEPADVTHAHREQHLPAFKRQPVKAGQQSPELRVKLLCQRLQVSIWRSVVKTVTANSHKVQPMSALQINPPSLPRA